MLHVPVIACAWIFSGHCLLRAQAPSLGFTPPKGHDVSRYEAGWARNPFAFKTVPTPPGGGIFARDMAIGSYYGSQENPTIVLVNTKTHERLRLKSGETSITGITLEKVMMGVRRSDCMVEIRGVSGETAQLRFDEAYLRQQAASATRNGPVPAPPVPPAATAPPVPTTPAARGAAFNNPPQRTSAEIALIEATIPASLRGIVPPSAFGGAPEMTDATSSASPAQSVPQPPSPVPLTRRRSITALGVLR
jgi:hypothetical protein